MADQKPVPGARWTRDGKELHCQDPACGWHCHLGDAGWKHDKLVEMMRGHRNLFHPGVDESAGEEVLTVLIQVRDLLSAIHQKIDRPPVFVLNSDNKLTPEQLDQVERQFSASLRQREGG